MKYRKRPLEVEAVYFDGNIDSEDAIINFPGVSTFEMGLNTSYWIVNKGVKGFMLGVNEWLIEGIEGELYACSDSVFQKSYEKVD